MALQFSTIDRETRRFGPQSLKTNVRVVPPAQRFGARTNKHPSGTTPGDTHQFLAERPDTYILGHGQPA